MNKDNQIPNGFKMTELGPLPEEWEVVKLGDRKYFRLVKSGIERFSGKKDYLSTSSIEGLNIIKVEQEITYRDRPSRANMQPILHSVWFARMINTKKVYAFTTTNANEINRYILSTGFYGAETSDRISPIFLKFYFFSDIFNKLKNSVCTGAVQVSLNNTNAKRLLIPLPSLPEQQKIASVLSAVQEAKEKTEAVIKATKELKKSLMKHLFSYGVCRVDELESVRVKETEIGLIPEHWDVVKLGEVADVKYGYRTIVPKVSENYGIPIITMAEITQEGYILWHKIRKIKINIKEEIKHKLGKGEILFNWRNSPEHIGKTAVFDKATNDPYICASFILRIIPNEMIVQKYFIHYFMIFLKLKGYFAMKARRAVGQTNFNASVLKELSIPLPPLPEQQKIAEILSAVDEKIQAEENKKKALEDLFKTLLHNLMTGKIRVK